MLSTITQGARNTHQFTYTVAAGENDSDGIEIIDFELTNSASIVDLGGRALGDINGSFSLSGVKVDTILPFPMFTISPTSPTLPSNGDYSFSISAIDLAGNESNCVSTVYTLNKSLSERAVVTGIYHSCALSGYGVVKCWGGNGDGQLGLGHTNITGDGAGEMGDNLPAIDLGRPFAPARNLR